MGIILLSLFLVILDQASKYFVYFNLRNKSPLIIIENFLNLYYLENRGAAFGILQEQRFVFTIITIVVVIVLLIIAFRNYKNNSKIFNLSIALILGGTIGNFIDRIRLHYVIDFISVKIFGWDFAVFNLADSFIVIGTILLAIIIILHDNPKELKNGRK